MSQKINKIKKQVFLNLFLTFFFIPFFFSFEGKTKEKKEEIPILPPFSFEEGKKKHPLPNKHKEIKKKDKGSHLGLKFSEFFHSTVKRFKKRDQKEVKNQKERKVKNKKNLKTKNEVKFENQALLKNSLKQNLKKKSKESSKENPFFLNNEGKQNPVQKKSMLRMLMSLGIIGGFGGILIFLAHWWRRNYQLTTQNKKIRILSQFYLGSKKRLMIIRVAGEHLLLGVTDSNISLIKPLSLIDEDSHLESEESFVKKLIDKTKINEATDDSKVAKNTQTNEDSISREAFHSPEPLKPPKPSNPPHSLEFPKSLKPSEMSHQATPSHLKHRKWPFTQTPFSKSSYTIGEHFIEKENENNSKKENSLEETHDLKTSSEDLEKIRTLLKDKLRHKKKIG